MSPRPLARRRGFTLPELVMVIVVIGILAVVTAPRFISWKGFASRGFYDEAQAVVRYARKRRSRGGARSSCAYRRPRSERSRTSTARHRSR